MVKKSKEKEVSAKPYIYTVGHSNRPFEEFYALLAAHGIEQVVDVRTVPRSRHNPQFNQASLARTLPARGIAYKRLELLGGWRHAKKDSQNLGWKNASFRGYADYMQSLEFAEGLAALMRLARTRKTAIMCAEAVPWRCHRSLIADALLVASWQVRDLMSEGNAPPHKRTPFLRVKRGILTYPRPGGTRPLL